jgi:glycosyltransferase involved in cell wall biosynthesis
VSWRVVHIVESLQPSAGSIAICVEGLLRALREAGVDSEAIDAAGGLDEAIRGANLLHVHGWGYELAGRAARTARKFGKPYVLSPLGSLTPGPHNRKGLGDKLRLFFGERSLVRGAAALAALNTEDDRRLRAANVHPNIRLLPYGLFFDGCGSGGGAKIADSAAATSARTLLLLGPIDPVYGCVALLKAFAELGSDADGWNVVLAGCDAGNWRKMLEAAVLRKGGEDRVRFADAKTPDEQRGWLSRASLLVAPSLHVRPAVSIMQAIAADVPAIASTFSAPPGLENVLRVCGPSRAELREELRAAMTLTDEQRRGTTSSVLTAAKASLDWSILAPKYAQLYSEIA